MWNQGDSQSVFLWPEHTTKYGKYCKWRNKRLSRKRTDCNNLSTCGHIGEVRLKVGRICNVYYKWLFNYWNCFFYRMSVQFLKHYDQLLNHHYLNTWNIWKWTRLHDFLQSKRSGVAEVKYAMIASLYGTYTLMIIISSRFMMGWPLVSVINSAHTTGNYTIYRNLSIIVNPVMLRLAIKCLKKKCTYGSFYFFKYMSFFLWPWEPGSPTY